MILTGDQPKSSLVVQKKGLQPRIRFFGSLSRAMFQVGVKPALILRSWGVSMPQFFVDATFA